MEAAAARSSLPVSDSGKVDYSQDFFGERAFLTVSGQLNGEGSITKTMKTTRMRRQNSKESKGKQVKRSK